MKTNNLLLRGFLCSALTTAFAFFIFAVGSASAIKAQSPVDGFDPNANAAATVRAFAVQPDGKILIGGNFGLISGTARGRIARLKPGGTLDAAFDPNVTGNVFSIAVQPDGKILLGGVFTTLAPNGGAAVTRNYIARVNADGTLDTAFDPNANNSVFSIAVQPDGKILLGGVFTTLAPNGGGAVTRNRVARVNADGTLDAAFDPNASNVVFSIAVQPDGKILLGGGFTTLAPNGGAAVTRNRIARVNADGTLDAAFDPNANNGVYAIAVQSDGKILLGGQFTTLAPNGGAAVTRNSIARLERDGLLDRTLNIAAVGGVVYTAAVQPDGKILIGGNFTSILGTARNRIARLNADGTLDTAFDPNANGIVYSIAVQPDGKILLGGAFTLLSPNGGAAVTRNKIARLNADGTLDAAFNPNANGDVYAIAIQSDGKILLGGVFTLLSPNGGVGVTRVAFARVNSDGTLDTAFNPNVNNAVYAIAVQPDGKILLGGFFTTLAPNGGAAVTRNYIARVNADGTLDTAFNPNANSAVVSIAIQPDAKVLLGGLFTTLAPNGGAAVTRNRIARVNADGTLDTAFNPNAINTVFSIALQSDGKILLGGVFTLLSPNGGAAVTRNYIARVNADGTLDAAFDPNANNTVYAIALQSDGKILLSGVFSALSPNGGAAVSRNSFARLSNDTAALSTFAVTNTTLTLTRDGSAPQFYRVIFERSTDNGATWTLLGTATNSFNSPDLRKPAAEVEAKNTLTSCVFQQCGESPLAPAAAGYTLTGQSIPTGQNVLIRARGFYRAGYQTGSETIEDKVRNVFLLAPTAAGVSISGRVLVGDGRGLTNARVYLTTQNGVTKTAKTSAFGYFRFDDIRAGQTVIISILAKRYQFAPQAVNVLDAIENLNFYAEF